MDDACHGRQEHNKRFLDCDGVVRLIVAKGCKVYGELELRTTKVYDDRNLATVVHAGAATVRMTIRFRSSFKAGVSCWIVDHGTL